MPKVKESYIKNKQERILDALFDSCKEKPLYEITLKDVISKSELSQGGIYIYFSDLDEIIAALINRHYKLFDYSKNIELAFENSVPNEVIRSLFNLLASTFDEEGLLYNKIIYELNIIIIGNAKRCAKINSYLVENPSIIVNKLLSYITQKIEEGFYNPSIETEQLLAFVLASMDGILRDIIMVMCYQETNFPFEKSFTPKKLFETLFECLIKVLEGSEI